MPPPFILQPYLVCLRIVALCLASRPALEAVLHSHTPVPRWSDHLGIGPESVCECLGTAQGRQSRSLTELHMHIAFNVTAL